MAFRLTNALHSIKLHASKAHNICNYFLMTKIPKDMQVIDDIELGEIPLITINDTPEEGALKEKQTAERIKRQRKEQDS
jgi:hypothetical protein